ncbi:transposable element Tcb2 transposase [Trichonephila clavipes]|nr:transposable element Tcb2 transposase [Trichonephila clavipes]
MSVVWTGKEEKEKWDDKKRIENREGSLGYPGFVKHVFTKDGKPLRKRKRSLGYLGIVTPVLTKRRSGSGCPQQTTRRENRQIVRKARVQPTVSSVVIQTQVEPSLGASVSSRTIRRRMAEGHLGSRRPLRVLPLTPTHRRLRLEWCRARRNWTVAEWNQVIFRDESRFNLISADNRVRVWRPRGEYLNPAFALQRHTAPTAGGMV